MNHFLGVSLLTWPLKLKLHLYSVDGQINHSCLTHAQTQRDGQYTVAVGNPKCGRLKLKGKVQTDGVPLAKKMFEILAGLHHFYSVQRLCTNISIQTACSQVH